LTGAVVTLVASQMDARGVHAPAAQTSPLAHACPHPPQFAASVCVVTHALPQRVHPI
jgi:hypothetical protein